jgi:hypothetical protein
VETKPEVNTVFKNPDGKYYYIKSYSERNDMGGPYWAYTANVIDIATGQPSIIGFTSK